MRKLAEQAKRGNPDAFVKLMELQKKDLYKVARGFFQNEEDIADVIQETVLCCYEHIGELKQPEYVQTWMTRILINQCNRLYRERKCCYAAENLPEQSWEDSRRAEFEFQQLISGLDEKYRLIFLLYYGEGFNTREIGEILELSENTVRSRLNRGKAKLRKEFSEDGRRYVV